MIQFTLKNMLTKKVKILLVVLSIVLSASVAILAYNVAQQVESGIQTTAAYYDVVIGPAGSSTQLAMNTMFFTDEPLGTIPYSVVEELQANPNVNVAVPFTMGDSYNSSRIIGTEPSFLDTKHLKEGTLFAETFEAVVGSTVARVNGLSIGDELITSHGLANSGEQHTATPLIVVGILDETHTNYDNVVFTDVTTVWAIHEHEEDEKHDEAGTDAAAATAAPDAQAAGGHSDADLHADEEEGHVHSAEGEVCAILLKCKTPSAAMTIQTFYNGKGYDEDGTSYSLQAIIPSAVLRDVLSNVDLSAKIVYVLCIIILIMNIIVISVITLLNLYDSRRDIALMRLIGVSVKSINLLFIIQNSIIGLISTAVAFAVSRLCLLLLSDFVQSMGIVLTVGKVFPLEWAIMALVFVLSVLPTFLCTIQMAHKDSLNN